MFESTAGIGGAMQQRKTVKFSPGADAQKSAMQAERKLKKARREAVFLMDKSCVTYRHNKVEALKYLKQAKQIIDENFKEDKNLMTMYNAQRKILGDGNDDV